MRSSSHRLPRVALVAAAGLAIAAIASGCGGSDDSGGAAAGASDGGAASKGQLRMALVIPDFTQNELILDQKNGAEAEAKKLGIDLTVIGSADAAEQARAVQNAIASKVDAIVYSTIDTQALTPAIEQANSAGIPVICDNACAAGGENAAEITFDYNEMGHITGKWIASQLQGGTGKVGIVDTNRADETVQKIYDGIEAGLEEAGADPKLVISPPTDWDAAKGLKVATDLFTANPDFDAVVCLHDLLIDPCGQAMKATDYKDVPLAGAGGTCAGLAALLTGKAQGTVAQFLYRAGGLGVAAAKKAVDGEVASSLSETAPMIGLTSESAKGMLEGSVEIPADLGLEEKLKSAERGCK
jgi:ABC-type sugar transport system substrate-binding protein